MDNITVEKETTIQSYGEFWDAFRYLKNMIDQNVKDWIYLKLSALTMACFTIEAFANHIGMSLIPSWNTMERRISPVNKLINIIEMKDIEIEYDKPPFSTVQELMQWRNKVAHGKTEIKKTSDTIPVHDYDDFLDKIEQADWRKYVVDVDIEKIGKDCEELMEIIHLKALGHLDWFLIGWWGTRSAHAG